MKRLIKWFHKLREPKPHKHSYTIAIEENGARLFKCDVKRCKATFDIDTLRSDDKWEMWAEKHYQAMKKKKK